MPATGRPARGAGLPRRPGVAMARRSPLHVRAVVDPRRRRRPRSSRGPREQRLALSEVGVRTDGAVEGERLLKLLVACAATPGANELLCRPQPRKRLVGEPTGAGVQPRPLPDNARARTL